MKSSRFSFSHSALLASLVGSALLLIACGGDGGSTAVATGPSEIPGAAATPTPATTHTPSATAVGSAMGGVTSMTIGAAGGRLSAPDGSLALAIPAGALASDTVIGLQPVTNMAHGKRGGAYRLTPDGQTFLKPVTLTFGYTDRDLLGTAADLLGVAFQTKDGRWQWVRNATIDKTAKTVSVGVTHFTDISKVAGLQIRPGEKTVKVKTSLRLEVVDCYSQDIPGSELVPLGYNCDSELISLSSADRASEWSVNGRLGGGGPFGSVIGNASDATYTAPNTAPTPKLVAVSARTNTKGTTVVVASNITIEEAALKVDGTYWDRYQLTGVICSLQQPFTLQAKANLAGVAASGVFSFTPDETVGGTWRYAGVMAGLGSYSGNGRYQLNGAGTESPALQMDPGNGTWTLLIPGVGVSSFDNGRHLDVQQTITTTPAEPCGAV